MTALDLLRGFWPPAVRRHENARRAAAAAAVCAEAEAIRVAIVSLAFAKDWAAAHGGCTYPDCPCPVSCEADWKEVEA